MCDVRIVRDMRLQILLRRRDAVLEPTQQEYSGLTRSFAGGSTQQEEHRATQQREPTAALEGFCPKADRAACGSLRSVVAVASYLDRGQCWGDGRVASRR